MKADSAADLLSTEDRALLDLLGALKDEGYRFTTVSPSTHARVNARPENARARSLADVFGWSRPFAEDLLPASVLGLLRAAAAIEPSEGLLRSRVRVSSLEADLFLHSSFPTLDARSVFFGPDTYRFARAIRHGLAGVPRPIRRAVDIGCGAAPGAVLVAHAAPAAEVLMVDINDAALRMARINAAFAGAERAHACRSDLLSQVGGNFDLIVANPPYLNDPLQRAYRHGGGRFGEALSLRILDAALRRLAPGGMLILYTGVAIIGGADPFRAAAEDRLASRGVVWSYEEIDADVFGEELDAPAYAAAERIAAVVLTVTREA
jgi:methylase of polypeptide subunit release factors